MRLTTRLRILDYLRRQQTASARELGIAFSMTNANIRHHLEILESNGLIEMIGQSQQGRGRPSNVYSLSRQVLGDGLDSLAGAMLEVWIRGISDVDRETALRSIAENLAGKSSKQSAGLLTLRLADLVERLNSLHYQARWEAGTSGPRVFLGHCPYAAVIEKYPELCRVDAYLLEHFIGFPAVQVNKLQQNAKGVLFCLFHFDNKRTH
jgi:predicted ArsR family transcriptional regulator